VKNRFQAFAFKWVNLYRYPSGMATTPLQTVGRVHELNPVVDPQLESAWFQTLSLSREKAGFKVLLSKFDLYRYKTAPFDLTRRVKAELYRLNSVFDP
jgi:hypothetical protein